MAVGYRSFLRGAVHYDSHLRVLDCGAPNGLVLRASPDRANRRFADDLRHGSIND